MAKEQKTGKIAKKPQKKAFSDIQKILEHIVELLERIDNRISGGF